MAFISPESFLSSMLNGSKNAVYCAVTLFTVYSVWMAISKIAEEGGLCDKLSTLLKKPIKRIFKTDDGEAVKCVSMNVVCNILGLGGAATPFAIRAINRFNGKITHLLCGFYLLLTQLPCKLSPPRLSLCAQAIIALAPRIYLFRR
ncbi:MAG: hypothetical protein J6B04_01825 [Clostridia bacterium]|nr:hypothetical protein [Clostridia bacterium]